MVVLGEKPVHFGSEFFMATRSHKTLLQLFRASVFKYIRSNEPFIQQRVLYKGRSVVMSCSVNKYIPRSTYPFFKVSDLKQHSLCIEGLKSKNQSEKTPH